MRITAVRDCTVPLGVPMHNASVSYDTMTASALVVCTDVVVGGQKLVGCAFDSIGRYGKSGILRERFIPRLLGASSDLLLDDAGLPDPAAWVRVLMTNEKEGGHGERPGAVGLLEAAAWDLRAKMAGLPLWRLLREQSGSSGLSLPSSIRVYGSCGHFRPGRGEAELEGLANEVRHAYQAGFEVVKIKLGGAVTSDDVARVKAAQGASVGVRIAVDVNGQLAPAIERDWLRAMANLGVEWVEEPVSPLDFERLADVVGRSAIPVATGENLFSFDDARNLLRYGGLRADRDLIQLDISLSYGVGEYQRILGLYESAGWSRSSFLPHAGHIFAAHVVGGLGLGMHEAATDPASPFAGLWSGSALHNGLSQLPNWPGVGFEHKPALLDLLDPLVRH
jgi:L-alanine-DL-glutamate epimerase-like enolase superfamily enzyme